MAKTKKIKRIMRKCPGCKTDLKKGGLRWIQPGEMIYSINHYKGDKDLHWEQEEFSDNNYDGMFCCADCGMELNLTEKEVIKILK